jgi:hypothetical protein
MTAINTFQLPPLPNSSPTELIQAVGGMLSLLYA